MLFIIDNHLGMKTLIIKTDRKGDILQIINKGVCILSAGYDKDFREATLLILNH